MKVACGPTWFAATGVGNGASAWSTTPPDSRWHTTTVLAALRVTGLTAPAVFDGPIDGVSFLAYIEQVLAPTLRPGDVVVLDKLSVHRSPAVRAVVETVGATLCFSPEVQPRPESD